MEYLFEGIFIEMQILWDVHREKMLNILIDYN